MGKKIRLSQCMIVKNEEKNIRRALSWAKEIAFEQIVVDTGSIDDTVKIAKEMGAQVYHFEWINDFAAAKNYAIEQAKGDWIAFLDADEYLNQEDARKVTLYLEKYHQKDLFRCAMVHLNDSGGIFALGTQDRFFRNHSSIRYYGKIHEQIKKKGEKKLEGIDLSQKITIYHTGYTKQVYDSTDKLERNILSLEKEVSLNPDDYNAWSYLGESLFVNKKLDEAERCLVMAMKGRSTNEIMQERYESVMTNYLRIAIEKSEPEAEILRRAVMAGYPNECNVNILFFLGLYYMNQKEYEKALRQFEMCIDRWQCIFGKNKKYNMIGNIEQVYIWMTDISRKLNIPQKVVHYGVLALRSNKYLDGVLSAVLECFLKEKIEKENANGTYDFLGKLYDYTNKRDLYFIYKCAKITNFYALQDKILLHFTEDEQKELRYGIEEHYLDIEGIPANNEVNKAFVKWVEEYQNRDVLTLKADLVEKLEKIKNSSYKLYKQYIDYHNKYQFWGTIDLDKQDDNSLEKRSMLIQGHMKDFIWLYQNLSDYCSKRTLLAILKNWTSFDTKLLADVKRNERCYFDLDLIPTVKNEVFVDLGAFVGDTIVDFASSYDKSYKKIYAYECSKENIEKLERATMRYERVQICPKAVGKESGSLFMKQGVEASSNRITAEDTDAEEKGYMVSVVSLDEDIKEPVTWIKMDIEGAEYDALLGAREHIIKDKPKLSISVYHGYDDLWRIPRLIHEMNPDYDFYLRHYGGNLIPTEFVLTAIPK